MRMNFGGFGPFSAPDVPIDDVAMEALSGKVFYVNANATGADDVDSPFPDVDESVCFSTLQAAIDACVASRGDIIIVKRGGEAVTTQVTFNKQGIRVISQRWGMSPAFRGEFTSIYSTTITDGPVAQIIDACYIEGLGFAGADATTTFYRGCALLIGGEATAEPYGVHLYQCRFPKWGLDNSKGIAIEGSSDCLIEECYFEGVGADFTTGIYVQGATANLEIRNCRFRDCDYAITHGAFADATAPSCIYTGNIVEGADSKFLNTGSNTAVGIICNNWFATDQGTSTNDISVADTETLGLQMTGNYYSTEEIGAT
jgi:hypothetical protein